jgi:hypothetical protein
LHLGLLLMLGEELPLRVLVGGVLSVRSWDWRHHVGQIQFRLILRLSWSSGRWLDLTFSVLLVNFTIVIAAVVIAAVVLRVVLTLTLLLFLFLIENLDDNSTWRNITRLHFLEILQIAHILILRLASGLFFLVICAAWAVFNATYSVCRI